MSMNGSGTTFNEDGADADFRVESDTNTHALFVDAGNNQVNIKGSTSNWTAPSLVVNAPMLDLSSSTARTTNAGIVLAPTATGSVDTNGWYGILFSNSHVDGYGYTLGGRRTQANGNSPAFDIRYHSNSLSGLSRLYFADTETVFNDEGADQNFRVESDAASDMFVIDAAENVAFFGGSSASGTGLSYITASGSMDMKSAGADSTSTRFRWTSPAFSSGNQTKHGIQLFNGDSDNLQIGFISDAGGSIGALFDTSNTNLGTIIRSDTNGVRLANNGTSWSSYSDSRLKTVTGEIPNAIDKIDAMRGVLFSWNDDEDNTQRCGVIAQEVQAVLPEVVDADTDYLQVRYTELVPLLIQGIKEQKATIETLEARITALENA